MRYGTRRLPERNAAADAALTRLSLKLREAGERAAAAFAAWSEAAAVYGDRSSAAVNAMADYYRAIGEAAAYKDAYNAAFAALSAVLKKDAP